MILTGILATVLSQGKQILILTTHQVKDRDFCMSTHPPRKKETEQG
ncbi:hypothetical protein RLOC_00007519 [Lonchura striata]|uniref:Uncharacterized protein n=1 Tax=Lonchura striata TaxID=40157 RepID=A0A218UPT0_9PASE|nr:hypothetical protein RLOC_00007519 [Lonchura striata domestica]